MGRWEACRVCLHTIQMSVCPKTLILLWQRAGFFSWVRRLSVAPSAINLGSLPTLLLKMGPFIEVYLFFPLSCFCHMAVFEGSHVWMEAADWWCHQLR